jgi:zinc transport system ATP-binding protein
MPAEQAVAITDLSFSYGAMPIVKNVSLTINAGEFIGLVGPNGGGKSTLVRLIAGLLTPQKGQVRIFGRSPQQARALIGYVPQYPGFSRDFPITVEQTVLMGCMRRFWGGYNSADRAAVAQALRETEISHLAQRPIAKLSGGELQRVLIARVLATNPRLLLLDEPTSNIDMRVENEIFDLLKVLNQRMTVVVVSHDIAFISAYVGRVACLNQTLVCHETEALTADTITQIYGDHVHAIAHAHHHPHP